MIAVLISLDRAADRRGLFVEALSRLAPEIAVERARAVDVSQPGWTVPEGYRDPHWSSDRWSLRPSDIEIFLSHIDAWKRIAAGSEGGIVFEDDILFSDTFGPAAAELARAAPEGIVKLDAVGAPHLMGPPISAGGLTLRRLEHYVPSAAAYFLTPGTARALAQAVQIERTVDDFLFDPYPGERGSAGHGLPIFQLDPAITVQGQFGTYADPARPVPDFVTGTKRQDLSKRKSRDLAGPLPYRLLKEFRRVRARRSLAARKARVLGQGGVFRAPEGPPDLKWF